MKISPIGFGAYRIASGNEEHEISLKKALYGGVNLIDTSTNYTDGMSEQLIGEVMMECYYDIPRDKIIIVSKYGYIQGQNMARHKAGQKILELVPFHHTCYHSIHPDFMRDQLQRSLERLQTHYIDIYLLHNPEYYLILSVRDPEEREEHQTEMLRRIGKAFEALEEEVQKGRIKAYGISSNSFGKSPDDLYFIPYQGLMEIAEKAAEKAGNEKHSFTTVEMPGNLLETEGLTGCAKWAHENGLNVLINRPLNAIEGDDIIRLAQYEKPDDYEETYEKIHKIISMNGNDEAIAFLEELHEDRGMIESPGHYDYIRQKEIVPFFKKVMRKPGEEYLNAAAKFMKVYEREVMHNISLQTVSLLKERGIEADEPLQKYALKFLMKNPYVTSVLLGMKRPDYVDDALLLMKEVAQD